MKFSDEQLSAFLDSELPPHEMEAIRSALTNDEAVADRLAELTLGDSAILEAYSTIDSLPLPTRISRILDSGEDPNTTTENTARRLFSESRRWQLAIAATVTLAMGVVLATVLTTSPLEDNWTPIATILESTPSDQTQTLPDGRVVLPRLTFKSNTGDYCRVFDTRGTKSNSQNLACRNAGQWQLAASFPLAIPPKTGTEKTYQPASATNSLDTLLDNLMTDSPLDGPYDRGQEYELIKNIWEK